LIGVAHASAVEVALETLFKEPQAFETMKVAEQKKAVMTALNEFTVKLKNEFKHADLEANRETLKAKAENIFEFISQIDSDVEEEFRDERSAMLELANTIASILKKEFDDKVNHYGMDANRELEQKPIGNHF
jgi:hypothetical protein